MNSNLIFKIICLGLLGFNSFNQNNLSSIVSTRESLFDNTKKDTLKFSVSRFPEWDSLFIRKSGWIGADGIFSATLNGNKSFSASRHTKTIFWFSDTIFGDIVNDSLQSGWSMVNNTTSILKDGLPKNSSMKFKWEVMSNRPQSTFVPKIKSYAKSVYYWLGDGFVNPICNLVGHALTLTLCVFGMCHTTRLDNYRSSRVIS